MASLPAVMALKSLGDSSSDPQKYLSVVTEGSLKGYLQYSLPSVSPFGKFEVEPAKSGGGLFHIKSYNNKYWVRSSAREHWIVAGATEPVEDQSAWNSTLFKSTLLGYDSENNPIVQFIHVQVNSFVGLPKEDDSVHKSCLCLAPVAVKPATSIVIEYKTPDIVSLPPFVALKSVEGSKFPNKHLGLVTEGSLENYLQYSVPSVNPTAKFAVELAKSGGGLVHIRSCYNNKYWVRLSAKEHWVVATATEPVEDQSAWNCTLFKPTLLGYDKNNNPMVQLVHVQANSTIGLPKEDDLTHNFCLCIEPVAVKPSTSIVVDYESLVILPKHVSFLGDNAQFLRALWQLDRPYLWFGTTDPNNFYNLHDLFIVDNGEIHLRNIHWQKFCQRSSEGWIWGNATSADSQGNPDALFTVVKVGPDVVALRNLGNNLFCKRFTTPNVINCLNANAENMTKETRLQVVEPVLKRSIQVLKFRTNDARIYSKTMVTLATGSNTNPSDTATKMRFQFVYNDTRTRSWTNSITIKLGVSTTIKTGIPFIGDRAKIEVSDETSDQFQWGETVQISRDMQSGYEVEVPPRTQVKVTMVGTQATCEVPFNYTQTDQLTNGNPVSITSYDGVFTGVNTYDIHYEVSKVPLN